MNIFRKPCNKTGSTKTVVIGVLAVLAIVFSVLNLVRFQKSNENPREHIEQTFKCPECGKVFRMTITEMHEKLRANSEDVVMSQNNVAVRCPDCGEMAELATQCLSCEKYFILPPPGKPVVCPYCETDQERRGRRGMQKQ